MDERYAKYGYTRVMSFMITKDDAEAFDKCGFKNKSKLFRFLLQAIIHQDAEVIQKLEVLIGTRLDKLDEFRQPNAEGWCNGYNSKRGNVAIKSLMSWVVKLNYYIYNIYN